MILHMYVSMYVCVCVNNGCAHNCLHKGRMYIHTDDVPLRRVFPSHGESRVATLPPPPRSAAVEAPRDTSVPGCGLVSTLRLNSACISFIVCASGWGNSVVVTISIASWPETDGRVILSR